MDELMLMKYLKSKGIENMSEQELIHKFKDFMYKHGDTSHMRYHNDVDDFESYDDFKDAKYRRGVPMKRNNLGYYDMYAEYPEYAAYSKIHNNPYGRFKMMQNYGEYPMDIMKDIDMYDEHFDEDKAKYIVSNMYHTDKDRKHTGEKFSMNKAREIHNRYKGIIPNDITVADVYVAINAQYHDYCGLFTTWFGSNIDTKIIESAMVFWFKDSDYSKGFKLGEYFKED